MFLDHPGMVEDSCLLHTATVEVVQVHVMCPGMRRAGRSVSGGYTRPVCRSMWCAVLCSAYLQRSVSGVSARACQPGPGDAVPLRSNNPMPHASYAYSSVAAAIVCDCSWVSSSDARAAVLCCTCWCV